MTLRTSTAVGHLWRILASALLFATGLITSRVVLLHAGVRPQRTPAQAPEETAVYYLLVGSVILAGGLVPIARGLRGGYAARLLVMAAFIFVGFGVNSTIEAATFSSAEGATSMAGVLAFPCLVLAGILTWLFGSREARDHPAPGLALLFAGRTPAAWAWRVTAAVLAFPACYFVFGILVSPVVSRYYREGVDGLTLPAPGLILLVELARSVLFLLVTLPVLVVWCGTRRQLLIALTLAFFVFVTAYDVVLAYRVPTLLLVTHGFEILADALTYALALVMLFFREHGPMRVREAAALGS